MRRNTVLLLSAPRGQGDQEIKIVGLDLRLVCRAVSGNGTAALALMRDDKAPPWIRLGPNGEKQTAARICPISRQNIDMQGSEAKGAMVA